MDNLEHANQRDRIVIIGMACRYPGANDYKEYWDNLVNGKNLIKEIPRMRWDTSRYYNENINTPNTSMSKWCGIVDEIETFDYKFFSISEREAKNHGSSTKIVITGDMALHRGFCCLTKRVARKNDSCLCWNDGCGLSSRSSQGRN